MSKRIGLVIYPGFQALDMAALTVFEFANSLLPAPQYELATLSLQGGPVRSSSGVVLDSHPIGWGGFDTLLIAGALGEPAAQPALEATLRDNAGASRRIASICTGAFVLARSGLMDGKRVTTHWSFGRRLQQQFPALTVDEDKIYVKQDKIWSSAGVTACIDMALAMVEHDFGSELARKVARGMVVYHRRSGGQSQFSAIAEIEPSSDRIKDALQYARDHLQRDLSVEELAARAHWSARHFSRMFQAQTGMAPAKAIEKLRLEAAQELIEQGHVSLSRIAGLTGFGDEERLRRAFLRAYGQPPKVFVQQARRRNEHIYLA